MLSREELERTFKRYKNPILYPGSGALIISIVSFMNAINLQLPWPVRVGAAVFSVWTFYFYYRIVVVFGERRDD